MVEDNIRIDYEKLRMLIRKDKEFTHDASIIQTLVSEGYVTGELKKGFPAVNITNPDNFVSLLYYFGMLTISGTYKGKTKLTIPNQVVREQIYTYLLSTYNEAELNFSSYEKNELASALAYDGDWKAYFGYIADCLKHYTSQRDKQKGDFFCPRLYAYHDGTKPFLPSHFRTGHTGRLCRHFPLSATGYLFRHEAQLYCRTEVCQV